MTQAWVQTCSRDQSLLKAKHFNPTKHKNYKLIKLNNQKTILNMKKQRNPKTNDPYDLILKSYMNLGGYQHKKAANKIQDKKSKIQKYSSHVVNYMTISSKGICTFVDGTPQDFTPLTECYPELQQAISSSLNQLSQIEQLIFIETEQYKQSDNNKDIKYFTKIQLNQIQQTQKSIEQKCKQVQEIYLDGIENRTTEIRKFVAREIDNKPNFLNSDRYLQINDNTYENIGFPENIPYDLRLIIKKECD